MEYRITLNNGREVTREMNGGPTAVRYAAEGMAARNSGWMESAWYANGDSFEIDHAGVVRDLTERQS